MLVVHSMHDKAQVGSLLCVLNWFIITVYFNCSIYKIKAICMYLDFFFVTPAVSVSIMPLLLLLK